MATDELAALLAAAKRWHRALGAWRNTESDRAGDRLTKAERALAAAVENYEHRQGANKEVANGDRGK